MYIEKQQPPILLDNILATGLGAPTSINFLVKNIVFEASLSGISGIVSATIELYGSNDPIAQTNQANSAKELLATFSLAGTGLGAGISVNSSFWGVNLPFRTFWGKVTAISGNGASVSLWAAV